MTLEEFYQLPPADRVFARRLAELFWDWKKKQKEAEGEEDGDVLRPCVQGQG